MRRADSPFLPDEASTDGAWHALLSRIAFTTERTLEAVEQLRAENEALRRRVVELESTRPDLRHELESVPLDELQGRQRTEITRRGPMVLSLLPSSDGRQGALLVEKQGEARASARLGPLEEELLRRLARHRACSGSDHPPISAKVLAFELGRSGFVFRPAPGTVRSAFTRVRRKFRALGFGPAVLSGGRQGYRLVAPSS